jgi:hypothetical protein
MVGQSPLLASEEHAVLTVLAGSRDRGEADRALAVLLTLAGWAARRVSGESPGKRPDYHAAAFNPRSEPLNRARWVTRLPLSGGRHDGDIARALLPAPQIEFGVDISIQSETWGTIDGPKASALGHMTSRLLLRNRFVAALVPTWMPRHAPRD